jgi:hypothetical protein
MRQVIHVVFASVLGAAALCAVAAVQRISCGISIQRLDLYIVPCLFGGIAGSLLGIWHLRLRRSQEQLRQANRTLEEKVLERTADWVRANDLLKVEVEERKRAEEKMGQVVVELKEALANVKTLKGMIPICANCKKIRNDQGAWMQMELYIKEHSDAAFSHGICPDCVKKLYPEFCKEEGGIADVSRRPET